MKRLFVYCLCIMFAFNLANAQRLAKVITKRTSSHTHTTTSTHTRSTTVITEGRISIKMPSKMFGWYSNAHTDAGTWVLYIGKHKIAQIVDGGEIEFSNYRYEAGVIYADFGTEGISVPYVLDQFNLQVDLGDGNILSWCDPDRLIQMYLSTREIEYITNLCN